MNRVIACGIIKRELEHLKEGASGVQVEYLPQKLHRSPELLNKSLQDAVNRPRDEEEKLILGYGLCCNAVVGIQAPSQGLYIPRVHDCITFFLGSREQYQELFTKNPGTYYLTSGWINNKKDPLGLVEHEYTERVGREMAEETMQTEIRNYKRISYIHTLGGREKHRERARKNAEHFQKEFVEHQINEEYFRKILFGPHEEPDFIYVKPNEKIRQQEFFK